MRKLILEEWVSVDGYAEDRHGRLDFFPSTDQNQFSDKDQLKFLDGIDLIILGRKTYELFAGFWPSATTDKEIIADKLNTIPKMVFSTTLTAAPWGKWPAAMINPGNVHEEIRQLKQKEGKDMVLWGSLSVAQSLIKEQLIDEYHLQTCPVLLGGGRQLFPASQNELNLELVEYRTYPTGVIFSGYRPLKGR